MKAILLIGGLVAASAAAAVFVYSGSSEEAAAGSSASPSGGGAKISAMTAAQVVADAKHSSPQSIITTRIDSPQALQKMFDVKGASWVTQNLTQPVVGDGSQDAGSSGRAANSDCPGETGDSPERTLYVRYVTDYPENEGRRATLLYTDINVPIIGNGEFSFESPFITENIIRDRYEWKRTYQVRWWQGVDQKWEKQMREEQDRLNARFMQAQNENPKEAMALMREIGAIQNAIKNQQVTAMNATVRDIVEVEAPSPAWSFKYNNETGTGDALYRRDKDIDYSKHRDKIEQDADTILSALRPIREFGESLDSKGSRTILGHTCEVISSSKWDAEHCVAEIDGQRITLWSRVDKAQKTAVYLDTSPCVSLAQFRPPANIKFDDKW